MKKLYKSNDNKVFAGVCGGLGEYLDTDPVVIRLVWIIIGAITAFFPAILAYIIAALIIPHKN